jgi:small subunit ribosomal protein S1
MALGRGGSIDLGGLQAARQSGAPVEGRVDKVVKAGLEIDFSGVRAFCPASQIELGYVEDLAAYDGQTLEFRVLEIRDQGRSIVVSRRAVLEAERRERERSLVEQLTVGAEVDGVVHVVQKSGAVVDLGGVEGFVHISEIAHHRVEQVSDELSPGQAVKATILSVEETRRGVRVRLSIKARTQAPIKAAPPAPDELLTGTVSRLTNFGVFVQTPKGEGLVPVRELGLAPGSDHRRAFPVGKTVTVVLVSSDPASGKLRFSVSGVASVEERRNYRDYSARDSAGSTAAGFGSLGDVFRQRLGLPEALPDPEPTIQSGSVPDPTPARSPASPRAEARRQLARSDPPLVTAKPDRVERSQRAVEPRRPDPDGVVRGRRRKG